MPDPVPTASGMPESGSGTPNIPSQNGVRPNGDGRPGQEGSGRDSSVNGAYIHERRTGAPNGRSDTPPESFLDFLDRLSDRVFTKNDSAWHAVIQFGLLVLLLPASVIGAMMAAHAVGVAGWAIGSGALASAGGAGAATVIRRRNAGRGTGQGPGRRGGGRRSGRPSRRQGSHRRR
ncbi:hypothetical protein [Streptomyces sp. NPDC093970]|uniref:hypothetical protein n=1 Tax=Streptomyces sp. NPDC093970 TaxID=3155076 RepID=UPI003427190C